MIFLAIECSQPEGAVTLARTGSGEEFAVLETVAIEGGMFSSLLVPAIEALLARRTLRFAEIEGYAVTLGPGTFTGLRIGLAAVKGFAEALPRPVAGVSSLEILAHRSAASGLLLTALDALRGEVYGGVYEKQGAECRKVGESLLDRESLLRKTGDVAAVVTPVEWIAELASTTGVRVERIAPPASEDVARIGGGKLLAGDVIAVDALDAAYLRRDESLFVRNA